MLATLCELVCACSGGKPPRVVAGTSGEVTRDVAEVTDTWLGVKVVLWVAVVMVSLWVDTGGWLTAPRLSPETCRQKHGHK